MKSSKSSRAFLKKLGKRVRELRKAQGLTQSQLAFEAGVRREAIGLIERGEQNPTVEMLYNLARVMEIPVKDMFEF